MSRLLPRARTVRSIRGLTLALLAALFAGPGCQRAERYEVHRHAPPDVPKRAEPEEKKPLPANYAWELRRGTPRADVRLEFVHEGTQPDEWRKLKGFWNDPLPAR